MKVMKDKGISTTVIVVAVIIVAAATVGSYMVMSGDGGGGDESGSVQGLVSSKLQPSVGDEWEYRMTTEKDTVFVMDLEVENLQTVSFGDQTAEAYVVAGGLDIEDWGELGNDFPGENLSLEEGSMTIYEQNALQGSTKTEIDFSASGSVQGQSFVAAVESTETMEAISGEKPDVVNVGDDWSRTEKKITDRTVTVTLGGEPQSPTTSHSESTKTANYEAIGTKNVTVEAGTFDTYKVKRTTAGSDNYTVDYYTSETKMPVKSVKYSDNETTSSMELISYNL